MAEPECFIYRVIIVQAIGSKKGVTTQSARKVAVSVHPGGRYESYTQHFKHILLPS